MRLISSKDFGKTLINETDSEYRRKRDLYDKFIEQPLKLEMFVPSDENGNILKEPMIQDYKYDDWQRLYAKYKKAKEKVLFEDFIYVKDWYRIEHKHNTLNRNCRQLSYIEKLKTVEDVLEFNEVILTPNATKQFL